MILGRPLVNCKKLSRICSAGVCFFVLSPPDPPDAAFALLPISNIPFVVVVEDCLVHRLGAQ